ncbi:hypothetical protein [Micromonospora sp. NBC_01392]|uniref:hypothetical protein n=1 Tax=unclassified Micromonospora TaxID=2617518 RepID=UPI0032481E03
MSDAEELHPWLRLRTAVPRDDIPDRTVGSPGVELRKPGAAEVGVADRALARNRRGGGLERSARSASAGGWVGHHRASAVLVLAAILAGLAWLSVAGLVLLAVLGRDGPEGMTSFLAVALMPSALVPALGLTAGVALLYFRIRGGRVPLLMAVVATMAALVVGCSWWKLVSILPL